MEIRKLRVGGLLLPSNVLMAPLAGYTCYPFRMLACEMGAGLCFTEMVSANGLKYQDMATRKLLFTTKQEKIRAVQLLGGNPAVMERMACSELLRDFDIIDINMGCPVPNVFKSGEGSALMLDWKRASAIIRGCRKSGKIVTVKCRTGIRADDLFAAEFARMCEDSGADMITIHGRSRSMMYDGEPSYEEIARAKAAVSIPVIANGGIYSAEDGERMMERTGADGIMIARYALENPFIFAELTGRPSGKNARQVILEQMELTRRYYDETYTLAYIRKLASYGMKKRKGTKKYKERLYRSGSLEALREVVELIFPG
ncbi:tRNA-dihydrouridine synthase family protein [Acetatifactor muris]|uniref:tRNA-dihydrouridine synthase n=1 Tax=Acetatifactor muris TaxID=879566 RepID=A0A2K4ZES5_9FIRM|nr:tRNA-dihydrouridine synthase family protein [Acetatifactor muris]MCR2049415.1 tRNA-dihydrouridine synthase family protein [Acetatifactor muris]SOY28949.1 putative tRNA-dihydrouridine synthase [Acetatifactor muris]